MAGERVVQETRPSWLRRLTIPATVLVVALPVVSWILVGRVRLGDLLLALPFLLGVAVLRVLVRPRLVTDREGIDLPRRGRRIAWDQVDHVRAPGPWDASVTLVLIDGRELRTPYAIARAEEIAALGGVPLR